MARVLNAKEQSVEDFLGSFDGDNFSYRTFFDLLGRAIPFAEGVILTTLPRGGLQPIQPLKASPVVVRAYSIGVHTDDRVSWRAISTDAAARESDVWTAQALATSPFASELLTPLSLAHTIALPLREPLLSGYPGVLVLHRTSEQGPFTDDESKRLLEIARLHDTAIGLVRKHRLAVACVDGTKWAGKAGPRHFVIDAHAKSLVSDLQDRSVDPRLRENISELARRRLETPDDSANPSDRVQLSDAQGDLHAFRVVVFKSYPALSDGPVVFFCAQPDFCSWSTVRPADVQADPELARLIPALRYMQDHFQRRIKLPEVAKAVHLSTFHFHRRFTELLGITPKHFLLECQVYQTKLDLVGGAKDLVDIAKASGFAHQSHFTSRFKQATGMTPTRWRRAANQRIAAK